MDSQPNQDQHQAPQPQDRPDSATLSRRQFLRRMVTFAGGAGLMSIVAACGGAPAAEAPTTAPAAPTAAPAAPTAAPAAPTAAPAATAAPIAPTAAGAATAAPAATTAAAPAGVKTGGSLTWALEQGPDNIIPFGGVSGANQWGKEFIYDSLVEWDKELNVKPALAESYETPDDKTWIWHLRQGVKFHDGSEVTADDVKYSIDLQANPPEPGVKIAQYPPQLESVEVVDKYTVKFHMKAADPTVLGYLAWARYSSIIPKDAYQKINVLTQGIGTGPFKLDEFVSNDRLVYSRNADFWKPGLPYLDKLTLKVLPDENARVAALRSGAIDGCTISADTALSLANEPNIIILKGLVSAPRVLQFTMKGEGKPWEKKPVRQAISKALDRQLIIDNVFGGEAVLTGPIPPGYGDWFIPSDELAANWYKQDLEGAKKLMADAGHADGFAITLHAISQPVSFTQTAEIVKEQLKELNIEVNVISEEIGTFAKRVGDGTYEWCATGRGMRHDPTGFLVDFGRPNAGAAAKWFKNGEGWKNEELSALYEKMAVNLDQPTRHQQVRQIQEMILDEVPHVYLVQNYKFHAIRNDVKDMYVAFNDFHTGLRMAWLDR
jgi:peptide/nickel transport system substrate-binding protein